MSTCLLKHASFNASINADNVSSSCILASPISLNRFQDAFSLDIPELSHIDNVFGWPFSLNAISGKYYVDLPDVNTIHVVNIVSVAVELLHIENYKYFIALTIKVLVCFFLSLTQSK